MTQSQREREVDNVTGRTVAVVLAGGKGTRLDPLTRKVCKPALSFGGAFRCIDFSLSNCVNSGISKIGVATQHKPEALLAHLWSHWNSAALGDAAVIHAWRSEERAARFGHCGTADAVYRNLAAICRFPHSLILVLAGDHIYKMDYRPMLEAHCARDAAVTIGCIEAPIEDAARFGIVAATSDGRIERFVEKPRAVDRMPQADGDTVLISTGIYVFESEFLAEIVAKDAKQPSSGHDFAADVLPQLIDEGRARAHVFRSSGRAARPYWRDIGTLRSYWQAHMELLGPAPLFELDDPRWPIGRVAARPLIVPRPTVTALGGTIEDCVVSAGCRIAGRVLHSVLSEAVEIGSGADVTNSVLLPGAVVGANSRLRGVIVDAAYPVADGTVIERETENAPPPVLSHHGHGRAAAAERLSP